MNVWKFFLKKVRNSRNVVHPRICQGMDQPDASFSQLSMEPNYPAQVPQLASFNNACSEGAGIKWSSLPAVSS